MTKEELALLVRKPINKLENVSGIPDGKVPFYTGDGVMKLMDISNLNNLAKTAKPLKPTDTTPTIEGLYKPTVAGTYTNAGGLIAKDNYSTLFFLNQGIWTKSEEKMPQTPISPIFNPISELEAQGGKQINDFLKANYANVSEVDAIQNDVDKIIKKSINLLNFESFEGATYSITSGKVTRGVSTSWISAKINVLGATNYFLQGLGTISNTSVLVVIFANDNLDSLGSITKADFSGIIATPLGTTQLFLRLANGVDIGFNPTNNAIKDTAMLSLGTTQKPFEKYGEAEIILPSNVVFIEDISLTKSINLLDKSKIESGIYNANGTVSSNNNRIRYEFSNTDSNSKILSGMSPLTSAQIRYIEQDVNNVVLNTVFGDGTSNPILISPNVNTTKIKFNLANVVDIGLNPTNNAIANSVMIEAKSALPASAYQPFGEFIPATKILGLPSSGNPKMFIEMIPFTTAYAGVKQEAVVAKIYLHKKDNTYIVHKLRYMYLAYENYSGPGGDFVGGKVVRYNGANLATYNANNNTMTEGEEVIYTIESEGVLQTALGWVGGYHGNENYNSVFFVIDGKVYNMTGDVNFVALPLTACNNFYYTYDSNLYENDGLPIESKALIAKKSKVNNFINGGYSVTVKLIFPTAKTIPLIYAGIVCMGKYFTTIITDTGKLLTPTASTNTIVNTKDVRKVFYNSNTINGSVTNEIKWGNDIKAITSIWDRASDTKYYRRLDNQSFAIGEVFETTTTVELL